MGEVLFPTILALFERGIFLLVKYIAHNQIESLWLIYLSVLTVNFIYHLVQPITPSLNYCMVNLQNVVD